MNLLSKIGSALGLGSTASRQVSADMPHRQKFEQALQMSYDRASGKTPSIAMQSTRQLGSEAAARQAGNIRGASGIGSALKAKMGAREGANLAGQVAKAGTVASMQERLGAEKNLLAGVNQMVGAEQAQELARMKAAEADASRRQQFMGALIKGGASAYGTSLLGKSKIDAAKIMKG